MTLPPSDDLVQVRLAPRRGTREQATIHAILDAGTICHLGYLHEGRPVVVPTLYGRDGDAIIVHGSTASRAMRAGAGRLPVCATVTLLDGLVLARSAFHHSANYRSVVVHGDAERVGDDAEKRRALRVLTDHVAPDRWGHGIREPDERELHATEVLRLPLTHAVAKQRTGGVMDEERDLDLDVWAGVVPVSTTYGSPVPDRGGNREDDRRGFPRWHVASAPGSPVAPPRADRAGPVALGAVEGDRPPGGAS